jgi:hypothetical protein
MKPLCIDLILRSDAADPLSTIAADPQTGNVPLSDPCHIKPMRAQPSAEIETGNSSHVLILPHDEELLM